MEYIIEVKNQEKKLKKMASLEERKKRTHRLIERGAILESFIEGGLSTHMQGWNFA